MRPISIRCSWGVHKFTEVDDCNRVTCERCGERKPVRFRVLSPDELDGRQMIRPKTRGAKR
jgi:hypothetical protein